MKEIVVTPTQKTDLIWIERALELADKGSSLGDGGPFGAVITASKNNSNELIVVGEGWNHVIKNNDPTAHAEVVAIRAACSQLKQFHLANTTLYSSCEPCPMCLAAAYWANIPRIVFAATRNDAENIGFSDAFIYQDIAQPIDKRKIKMQHFPSQKIIEIMKRWQHRSPQLY
ncbi:MAG: nucleoside deaminase [Pseudomonadota bacterium]